MHCKRLNLRLPTFLDFDPLETKHGLVAAPYHILNVYEQFHQRDFLSELLKWFHFNSVLFNTQRGQISHYFTNIRERSKKTV